MQTVQAVWADKIGVVNVTVQKADGTAGAFISILGTGLSKNPVTNASGTVRFELPNGTYYLMARDAYGLYAGQEVVVDGVVDVVLTLQKPETNWSFDQETGTLSITGVGPMTDFTAKASGIVYKTTAPWAGVASDVRAVEIQGVTSVGNWAFYGCENLVEVTLPDYLTKIGINAFHGCENLVDIQIPSSVTEIGMYAFYRCKSLRAVMLPAGITEVSQHIFQECTSLSSVGIPEGVTIISFSAFSGCTSLKRVDIPDSVYLIYDHAFAGSGLTGVELSDNVRYLYDCVFLNCEDLVSVRMPASLSQFREGIFEYCSSLTGIVIPDGVTSIPKRTCWYCTNLTSVTIPACVEYINITAFEGANKLTDVYFEGTQEQWEAIQYLSEYGGLVSGLTAFRDNVTIHFNCTTGE